MSRLFVLLLLAATAALSINTPSAAWLGGPDVWPFTPRQQAQELARRLHALRGPDGWHLRVADPWGNPLDVEYERDVDYETLRGPAGSCTRPRGRPRILASSKVLTSCSKASPPANIRAHGLQGYVGG
jgi:hypothetical protein